jgi:exodeoxyribonuclease V alpha subunit
MADWIARLSAAEGELSTIDVELARGLDRMAARVDGGAKAACENADVLLAAALASRPTRQGHVCLDLDRLPPPPVEGVRWPSRLAWEAALRASALVGDASGSSSPLVLDGSRLYLRRYFRYETRLASELAARVAHLEKALDGKVLRASLDRLFPRTGLPSGEIDRQRLAALVAAVRRFCIISGGPGTGKTTTVVKILALLAEQGLLAGKKKLHAVLLAPTGKAAARLHEAIVGARAKLPIDDRIRALVPDETSTIHRALKPIAGTIDRFRHDEENPLPADVLLVDEASMVDLALMTKLVTALPSNTRLILLGDRNQLASVEAGAILGDLCGPPRPLGFSRSFARHVASLTGDELPVDDALADASIADCVVQLRRNYRYPESSGIGRLAQAINDGDVESAAAVLSSASSSPEQDVVRHPGSPDGALGAELRDCVIGGYSPYLRASSAPEAFDAFGRFRVLCAHRRGPHGVESLNPLLAATLADAGLLQPIGRFYLRRPVLVTENDYQVHLFNGDVGLVMPDPDDGNAARVWFFGPDGKSRRLAPSRLPPHESVFAMTVHRAQGSEFDEVALVLPAEASRVLTRELLYTAVTRARRRVAVFGKPDVIAEAIARPIERASGLRERLWGYYR